jgi:carbohydrate-selective porin OprB
MKALVLTALLSGAALASLHSAELPETTVAWWNGGHGSGEWLGVRPELKDHGIDLSGKWIGTFYGVVSGGRERHGAFDQSLHFDLKLDFAKLTGWEGLAGLTGTASVRYRDGSSVNEYVGASSTFNPSTYQSGKQWRLMPFYLTYTTPELFGVKNLLTISGGWQDPYEIFAQQPDSKFFRNNAIISSKGISANGVGWSSSYAAWGGYLKVKPVEWYYAQAGIYLAIPEGTNTANHGLDLQGALPANRNGWFILAETGVTPRFGPDELPGKYAMGGYYWGIECESFSGASETGRYGFYWQADQMLWREPQPSAVDKKTLPSAPNDQGLRWFSFFNFAPPSDNVMPFYFHTGLVYKGLIPTRDADQAGVAFALGNYSYDKIQDDYRDHRAVHQTYEGVLEADYRIQVNRWAFVQPYVQYVIRPGGTGLVQNATVLGLHFGVEF